MSTKLSTAQQLEAILSEIDDRAVAEDLFNRFYLLDPLQFARLLHHSELVDGIKAQLLALKVDMKPPYNSLDLEPLIERSMQLMWERLGEVKV